MGEDWRVDVPRRRRLLAKLTRPRSRQCILEWERGWSVAGVHGEVRPGNELQPDSKDVECWVKGFRIHEADNKSWKRCGRESSNERFKEF